eukprot:1158185-Pelagomonas_calceolata.AAC.3
MHTCLTASHTHLHHHRACYTYTPASLHHTITTLPQKPPSPACPQQYRQPGRLRSSEHCAHRALPDAGTVEPISCGVAPGRAAHDLARHGAPLLGPM